TCNHCPYARAYESRICKIAETYKDQGIETVAICSNDGEDYPEDSFEQMINKSRQLGFPFPYLHDDKQQVAKAYDAACTPEAYLFDEHQKLFYHGWIDDNHGNPEQVKSHDLENAIKALLSNSLPPKAETPVLGCSIKWNIG
ncbi:MAG: thioredoxin family protein, partial [Proteobacteria bacterium]|nr:thioredoxin family protein [Pseudomonadota bacterium]